MLIGEQRRRWARNAGILAKPKPIHGSIRSPTITIPNGPPSTGWFSQETYRYNKYFRRTSSNAAKSLAHPAMIFSGAVPACISSIVL